MLVLKFGDELAQKEENLRVIPQLKTRRFFNNILIAANEGEFILSSKILKKFVFTKFLELLKFEK